MKFIDKPFVRYIFVGGLNTAFTYVIYLLVLQFFLYPVAYTMSYLSGIFTSYIMNSKIVFSESLNWKKALKYPIVYLIQYVIGFISLAILVETLGIDARIAAIINIVIAIPITFVMSRWIIKTNAKTVDA